MRVWCSTQILSSLFHKVFDTSFQRREISMFFCKTSTIFPPRREIYMDKNGFENEDFTSKRFIQIHIYSRSSSRISISSFEIFLTYHPLLVKKKTLIFLFYLIMLLQENCLQVKGSQICPFDIKFWSSLGPNVRNWEPSTLATVYHNKMIVIPKYRDPKTQMILETPPHTHTHTLEYQHIINKSLFTFRWHSWTVNLQNGDCICGIPETLEQVCFADPLALSSGSTDCICWKKSESDWIERNGMVSVSQNPFPLLPRDNCTKHACTPVSITNKQTNKKRLILKICRKIHFKYVVSAIQHWVKNWIDANKPLQPMLNTAMKNISDALSEKVNPVPVMTITSFGVIGDFINF